MILCLFTFTFLILCSIQFYNFWPTLERRFAGTVTKLRWMRMKDDEGEKTMVEIRKSKRQESLTKKRREGMQALQDFPPASAAPHAASVDKKLESLLDMVAGVWSDDPALQLGYNILNYVLNYSYFELYCSSYLEAKSNSCIRCDHGTMEMWSWIQGEVIRSTNESSGLISYEEVAQGAKLRGAVQIIGIDITPAKAEQAKTFDVTYFINSNDYSEPIPQVIKRMTGGGADFSFECVGDTGIATTAFQSCSDISLEQVCIVD